MKWIIPMMMLALLMVACAKTVEEQNTQLQKETQQIANPASTNCINKGYKLEMRETAAGTAGICIAPNGKECDEWALFRNECSLE